ncbi:hypothetical protein Pan241w_50850 [Gimesia alba]|uniref:Uncharacterized protein n=1 Tax=Gimesia alba TaxID=2527973 RepID=A0A517RM43_9PLAN|nr:hypothetical protein Pan241w_50850 [Gimesia alba]
MPHRSSKKKRKLTHYQKMIKKERASLTFHANFTNQHSLSRREKHDESSAQDVFDHMAVHVGQTMISAAVPEGECFMIHAQLM